MPRVRTARIDGRALRDLRERRGLSVQQLARKIGRHRQAVTRLEIGKGKPASLVFANQLAIALGLLDDNGEPDISPIVLEADDSGEDREAA